MDYEKLYDQLIEAAESGDTARRWELLRGLDKEACKELAEIGQRRAAELDSRPA